VAKEKINEAFYVHDEGQNFFKEICHFYQQFSNVCNFPHNA